MIQQCVFGSIYVHLRPDLWELITTKWFETQGEAECFNSPVSDLLWQKATQMNIIADKTQTIIIITIVHHARD